MFSFTWKAEIREVWCGVGEISMVGDSQDWAGLRVDAETLSPLSHVGRNSQPGLSLLPLIVWLMKKLAAGAEAETQAHIYSDTGTQSIVLLTSLLFSFAHFNLLILLLGKC